MARPSSAAEGKTGLSPELKGILLTLAAMGMFGCMDGFSKLLVQTYPPWLVLWVRHMVALVLVLAVLAPRHPVTALRASRRPGLQVVRTLLLVTEMGFVLVAYRTLPLADAHAIFAASPLVVTALSVPLLGEQVGWRRWLAVAFGFFGVLVILRPGLVSIEPAALLATLCMLMYAGYLILTRLVARVDRAETSYLVQTVTSAIALSIVGPFFWMPLGWRDLPLFVGLGALGALGHYCLVRALAVAPAVVVQPFTYTLLLWAVLIGYVVFGDFPDAWTIGGAMLVAGAGLYAAWREHVRTRARTAAVLEGNGS
jgi:drug/metabolite transporter (DMT)-like permease